MAKQSPAPGPITHVDARHHRPPGEDPGTLTDEEYLSAGGPDALDAAAPQGSRAGAAQRNDERTDDVLEEEHEAHADSPPQLNGGGEGAD